MKTGVIILFVLITQLASAQKKFANYSSIDWNVLNIEASTPAELAQKLTSPYKTDIEKVRAIFSWIAQHISYGHDQNTSTSRHSRNHNTNEEGESVDTTTALIPLNELVAEDVLKKRIAFCYGYSRLFQCLCDDAGIPCEVINGYARGDSKRIGTNFRTNHSWNAVRLDSSWYLVDVTWASGYFTYNSNEFVRHFDDQYFLTSPDQF
ncbi:MAG TPA: transglutaminase domain-containing protein, partial [Chitinophagaceae bacterium]|nr:transglutaminase domain-containing protein [Chitinophagaceae bacterium]